MNKMLIIWRLSTLVCSLCWLWCRWCDDQLSLRILGRRF